LRCSKFRNFVFFVKLFAICCCEQKHFLNTNWQKIRSFYSTEFDENLSEFHEIFGILWTSDTKFQRISNFDGLVVRGLPNNFREIPDYQIWGIPGGLQPWQGAFTTMKTMECTGGKVCTRLMRDLKTKLLWSFQRRALRFCSQMPLADGCIFNWHALLCCLKSSLLHICGTRVKALGCKLL
jgi:hypothetical protein